MGDTHGALDITAYVLQKRSGSELLCFLGDMVDRGDHQLLNLLLLVESCIMNRKIVLIRGNHETTALNRYYGFEQELLSMGVHDALFEDIKKLYGKLPYACVVNGKVLGVHGGIPSGCNSIDGWNSLPMGEENPSDPCAFEILWNDPSDRIRNFEPGVRGEGTYIFGRNAFDAFMKKNDLELLVRGHEVKMEGYEFMFRNRLVTIFSARYHGGRSAILDIHLNSKLSTKISFVPDSE